MTIEDRITELMAHHKDSLARMVAESEPNAAAELIAALRTQNAAQASQITALQQEVEGLQAEITTLEPNGAAGIHIENDLLRLKLAATQLALSEAQRNTEEVPPACAPQLPGQPA